MNYVSRGPRVEILPDFDRLYSDHPSMFGIGCCLIDIENMVAPYGGDTVWPRYHEVVASLIEGGVNACLVTNMKDGDRAQTIAAQLDVPVAYQGMPYSRGDITTTLPSKSHPYIFQAGIEMAGHGSNGHETALVDDQLKNLVGAAQVESLSTFFWTFQNGIAAHPMVAAGRLVEVPLGLGLVAAQKIHDFATGQIAEW